MLYAPLPSGQPMPLLGLGTFDLRWLLEKKIGAIPHSRAPERWTASFALFDGSLNGREMERIDHIEQTLRVITYWPGELEKGE